MMTFNEFSNDYLIKSGMQESDARAVIEAAKQSEGMEAMIGLWDNSIDGYPPVMKASFHMSIKRHALEYIDANMPEAWFRDLFV
jgi:hypothetical protein